MTDEKPKGILFKIFGPKKSCCCNVQIEEVPEEDKEAHLKKNQIQRGSCCGARPEQK